MKQLLLIFLFFVTTSIFSQKIRFEYDASGNQILRKWCTNCLSRESTEEYKEILSLQDTDLQKFFSQDVISYYPNPVKEELYLKWNLINNNAVSNIEIYSFGGQLVSSITNLEKEESKMISFQDYPVGSFLVLLHYTNGEQKSITIIKQ
jgi:hypothetical protein